MKKPLKKHVYSLLKVASATALMALFFLNPSSKDAVSSPITGLNFSSSVAKAQGSPEQQEKKFKSETYLQATEWSACHNGKQNKSFYLTKYCVGGDELVTCSPSSLLVNTQNRDCQ